MSRLLKEWNRLAFRSGNTSLNENSNARAMAVSDESIGRYFEPYPGPMNQDDWYEWIEDMLYKLEKTYILIEWTPDWHENPKSFYNEIQYFMNKLYTGDGMYDFDKYMFQEVRVHDPDEPEPDQPNYLRWIKMR